MSNASMINPEANAAADQFDASRLDLDPVAPQRVAIIAIHGVGDPKPGDTASAVARLLVSQAGYSHEGTDCWLVPVQPVHPGSQVAPTVQGATAFSSAFTAARAGPGSVTDADPQHNVGDLGLQLNYHLLRGTVLPDEDKIYAAHRHHLGKQGSRVEVLDLYWGDLSGLDGAVTRIIAELYTLIFHLCQLGRDTVHHTAIFINQALPSSAVSASILAHAHQWADLLFTKPSGLLNALLVVVAMWWFPLAALHGGIVSGAVGVGWQTLALGALGVVVSLVGAALFYVYGRRALWPSIVLTVGWFWAAAWLERRGTDDPLAMHAVAVIWALLLAALYGAFLGFCESRVRGVGRWGLWLGLLVAACMGLGVWRATSYLHTVAGGAPPLTWVFAALSAIEIIGLVLLLVWASLALAVAVLALAGAWLKWQHRGNPTVTGGVDTGRFGLHVSIAMFITLTCSAWALAIGPLKNSFGLLVYDPLLPALLGPAGAAKGFVGERFDQSTLMFAPVLVVMLVMLGVAIALLFPSVAAEFTPPPANAPGEKLGRWLSGLGRGFTWASSKVIFGSALLFTVWSVVSAQPPGTPHSDWFNNLGQVFSYFRQNSDLLLSTLTYLVAGSAAGLLVIGARVFSSVRDIRLALDAALDVDRHFREFPDKSTPRGRIAARLHSVLQAVKSQGYERVVICAHSQGTIITAELLRDLQFRDPAFMRELPPIHLFTCGSPLRQLYAARFPALYTWMQGAMGGANTSGPELTGPSAGDLGVTRWTNAYCTGDYVGRWLWARPGQDLLATGQNFDDGTHRQHCLGKGAHTHYYDARMTQVAQEIDRLTLG
jgi:hypothetical protein